MRRIVCYIIIGLMYPLSLLPLRVHYFFSDIIAFLLHKVFRYRYGVIMMNLSRSFPDHTYHQLTSIVKKFYHHLSDMIVEAVWALSRSNATIGKRIEMEGVEELNHACSLNKGVIAMLGHTGNWEIFTGLPDLKKTYGINLENSNFNFIYKRQSNKIADMLIKYIRNKHHSCVTIESKDIIRHIVKNPESSNVYFLLCDQNPRGCESDIVVPFLNQKTYMIEGPERIAAKMKMPVMYVSVIRDSRRKNKAVFKLIAEDASVCEKGWVTAKFAELLEKDIKENKHQWLWSHKRWKKIIV